MINNIIAHNHHTNNNMTFFLHLYISTSTMKQYRYLEADKNKSQDNSTDNITDNNDNNNDNGNDNGNNSNSDDEGQGQGQTRQGGAGMDDDLQVCLGPGLSLSL